MSVGVVRRMFLGRFILMVAVCFLSYHLLRELYVFSGPFEISAMPL